MQRCLQLAELGSGQVAPNPMVGAVLIHNNIIIGEGYHKAYGEVHAEVNCLNSVAATNKQLVSNSTLYVSLEPCSHFGKTPPCTNLIIANSIPAVVIGCKDSFEAVNGNGIRKLREAGIQVTLGVMEEACIDINRRFFTFHNLKRPYIILKWAQSKDGFIAGQSSERTLISNEFSNRLVHKWRSEESAILVGSRTARLDNPALTTRYWPGKNPVRIVFDRDLKLPGNLRLFDKGVETIVFNHIQTTDEGQLHYHKIDRGADFLEQVFTILHSMQLQSVLVEGGAEVLKLFIASGKWDEARVITNSTLQLGNGVTAPELKHGEINLSTTVGEDIITIYRNSNNKLTGRNE